MNLDGAIWKEFQQMQVCSLPLGILKNNEKIAEFIWSNKAPEHQEMNGQVELIWRTLHTVSHAIMVYAIVLESYSNFTLMYTTYHICLVLPIKDVMIKSEKPTMFLKLSTGMKPSVTHFCVLFCPCVVRKANAHV